MTPSGSDVRESTALIEGGRGIRAHPRLAVLLAAAGLSFTGILFVLSDTSPATASFFRCLYALPVLFFLARRESDRLGPRTRSARLWAWLAGMAFAVDLVLFHHGILLMGAGLATVMSNLQVVIVLVVAWLAWGERPAAAQLCGVPIALVGVVLISGIVGADPYGADPLAGVLVGLVVAASYAAYLLLIRKGRDPRHVAGPIADATLATAVTAGLVGIAGGELDLVPIWPGHAWLLVLALTAQVAAGLLLAVALPRLPALTTSLMLLVQPVLTVVLAMLLIGEAPSTSQLAGVGLVIVGVFLGSLPWARMAGVQERLGTDARA